MYIAPNSAALPVRTNTPVAPAAPARVTLANVDRFEGPSEPPATSEPEQPETDPKPTVDDAKAHLASAAEEAGRILLWPIDAAVKAAEMGSYYLGLFKRAVNDVGIAAKELLQVTEKVAVERATERK